MKTIAALIAVAGVATAAQAAYGLKYEVSKNGGAWTSSITDAAAGDVISFRISAYHTGDVLATNGATLSRVSRHVGSHKISNWDSSDASGAYAFQLPQGNALFNAQSTSGSNRIFGTANNAGSFTAFVSTAAGDRSTVVLSTILAAGSFTIGGGNLNRVMTLSSNSYGAGLADGSTSANPVGLTFYTTSGDATARIPAGQRSDLNATVTVIPTPGSLALVGLGGLVAARRRRA